MDVLLVCVCHRPLMRVVFCFISAADLSEDQIRDLLESQIRGLSSRLTHLDRELAVDEEECERREQREDRAVVSHRDLVRSEGSRASTCGMRR